MTIKVPRPLDPELARLWDEAKRAVEARDFWRDVSELAAMRSDIPPERRAMSAVRQFVREADSDCCVGDRSRCRCQPSGPGWSDDDVEREKWMAVWSDEP